MTYEEIQEFVNERLKGTGKYAQVSGLVPLGHSIELIASDYCSVTIQSSQLSTVNVSRSYLNLLDEEQTKSIMAHELGHMFQNMRNFTDDHAKEYDADRRALELGATKKGLIGALQTLCIYHNVSMELETDTHPSVISRIAKIKKY